MKIQMLSGKNNYLQREYGNKIGHGYKPTLNFSSRNYTRRGENLIKGSFTFKTIINIPEKFAKKMPILSCLE
jgi:hypothetical protein